MQKGENVTTYLTGIWFVRDKIAVVGEKSTDYELVHITFNGFTNEYHMLVHVISGNDKLPYWEHLWSDFTQEELRLNLVEGTTSSSGKGQKVKEEQENVTLLGKGKEKKGPSQG